MPNTKKQKPVKKKSNNVAANKKKDNLTQDHTSSIRKIGEVSSSKKHFIDEDTLEPLEFDNIDYINEEVTIAKSGVDTVWTDVKNVPIKKILTYVPIEVLYTMLQLETMMDTHKEEIGVYLKGEFEGSSLHLTSEMHIPKQIVTSTSIDFIEDPPDGFNGIIHRHPKGCLSFSGIDDSSINQNFDFSLLFVNGDITIGVCNISREGWRFQLDCEIHIVYDSSDELTPDILATKIFKKIKKVKVNKHASKKQYTSKSSSSRYAWGLEPVESPATEDGTEKLELAVAEMLASDSDVDTYIPGSLSDIYGLTEEDFEELGRGDDKVFSP